MIKFGVLPTPTWPPNHTFNGWYTAKTGGTKVDSNYVVTNSITLYAQWAVINYTIILNAQGGTGGSSSVEVSNGSKIPNITIPKKTGYTFLGYYTGTNATGTKYINSDGTSAKNWDKTSGGTLYAAWSINDYELDINPDGNVYGRNVAEGSHVKSFDLRILDENGNQIYNGTGIDDFCDRPPVYSGYGHTYYVTNIQYMPGYSYSSMTLVGAETGETLNFIEQTDKKATFKHNYGGGIHLSINTQETGFAVTLNRNRRNRRKWICSS